MPKAIKPLDVLTTKMISNDAGAKTIKEYLIELLKAVWEEGESFSGKRPFGNSGWEGELYASLVKQGLVEGDSELTPNDDDEARQLITEAIQYLSTH